jgi:uncharacterized protein involved in response to NO
VSTDNPIDSPEAGVSDGQRGQVRRQRPRQILQAIALLWISTGLGFAAGYPDAIKSWQTFAVSAVFMLAVTVTLTAGVWRGRNWGRLAYLILVLLSFMELVASWDVVERAAMERALEAVSFVADAGSFFLMFTVPGASWFVDPRDSRA